MLFRSRIETVRLLLEMGAADVNDTAFSGYTALMAACLHGYKAIVSLLLENGADVNAKSQAGITALLEATSGCFHIVGSNDNVVKVREEIDMVCMLLNYGADVNSKLINSYTPLESGSTALMSAIIYDKAEIAKILLDRGADV